MNEGRTKITTWINDMCFLKTPLSGGKIVFLGIKKSNIEGHKRKVQAKSLGRRIRPSKDGFERRETIDAYNAHFGAKKCDIQIHIGTQNSLKKLKKNSPMFLAAIK